MIIAFFFGGETMTEIGYDSRRDEEKNCIWAEAGVISYKLCDKEFDCDNCPFDSAMKQQFQTPVFSQGPHPDSVEEDYPQANYSSKTPHSGSHDVIESLLHPLSDIRFPEDRVYHTNHTWIIEEVGGQKLIGLDHFGMQLLGPVVSVVLPRPRSKMSYHIPFVWLIHREGTFPVLAPADGTVIDANSALMGHPELLFSDSYNSGWLVRILASQRHAHARDTRLPHEHEEHSRHEIEMIRTRLLEQLEKSQKIDSTLFDGGLQVKHLADFLGFKEYLQMMKSLLGAKQKKWYHAGAKAGSQFS